MEKMNENKRGMNTEKEQEEIIARMSKELEINQKCIELLIKKTERLEERLTEAEKKLIIQREKELSKAVKMQNFENNVVMQRSDKPDESKIEKNKGTQQENGLEWRIEMLERGRKRKNIVITGLEEKYDERSLEEWCKEKLNINARFTEIWNIRYCKNKIGVRCVSRRMKEEIMQRKRALKGTNVYIDHDTTWLQRRNREKKRLEVDERKANEVSSQISTEEEDDSEDSDNSSIESEEQFTESTSIAESEKKQEGTGVTHKELENELNISWKRRAGKSISEIEEKKEEADTTLEELDKEVNDLLKRSIEEERYRNKKNYRWK